MGQHHKMGHSLLRFSNGTYPPLPPTSHFGFCFGGWVICCFVGFFSIRWNCHTHWMDVGIINKWGTSYLAFKWYLPPTSYFTFRVCMWGFVCCLFISIKANSHPHWMDVGAWRRWIALRNLSFQMDVVSIIDSKDSVNITKKKRNVAPLLEPSHPFTSHFSLLLLLLLSLLLLL